jgi:probable rRNA maturation factor
VTVLVTGNRELQALNRRFRGQNRTTDVLSFSATADVKDGFRGDIALSAEMAAASAARLGHSVGDELKILTLHGVLHLAGYDHEDESGKMSRLEARLRRKLRLPDSLIQRADQPAIRMSSRVPRSATDVPRRRRA